MYVNATASQSCRMMDILRSLVATRRKPQCHDLQAPCPLKSNPPTWFHYSLLSSLNFLTKSLYLKSGIEHNLCTIRPRLNQLWPFKLNEGFIIEQMIKILVFRRSVLLLSTLLVCVTCLQRKETT